MSQARTDSAAIETKGLTKQYRSELAVHDLTLRIPQGTAFGFLGPNGAGKTTTIKMLMGLLAPDRGRARVMGHDPLDDPLAVKARVGYVPEEHHMHRWMRVGEAIGFCQRLYPTWDDALSRDLRRQFGLDPRRRIRQLSKGMLTKLSLLLALSHDPEVLLLDEPMAGLDPLVREELLDGVLRSVCDRGQTVLFSSHTMADVQRLADRVGIIDAGEILVDCPVDDLLGHTKRIRAVITDGGVPSAAPSGTIWQRQREREWLLTVSDFSAQTVEHLCAANPVEGVEVIDLNLEEVFKDYIRGRRASA